MDVPTPFLLLIIVLFSIIWYYCISVLRSKLGRPNSAKLPPGPYPFPIIGNIFHIRGVFHESIAKFSRTYGALMSLKLGNKTILVVSSPEIAKEFLQKHDLNFSSRSPPDAVEVLDHHKLSVVWLPAGTQWRNLRKLCREQMFSSERLNASQELRQEKVQQLCSYVHECCINGLAVDIGEAAFTTSLNLISNTLFSVDFAGYHTNSSQELKEIIWGLMKTLGAPNLADFFPVLKAIDLQGIKHQARFYFGKLLDIIEGIMTQRIQERATFLTSTRRNDLLDILLDLNEQKEAEWNWKEIKHLLLDLFVAGTETTSATLEWAMAELMRNPEKMKKARAEIREVLGQSKLVQESDISRLPYLQALIKETFRLHPVGTVLVRQAEADIEFDQYIVPKDAQLLVNLWGMGRDPNLWVNPDSFVPERFLDSEIDVKGQHFELLTFGTGRRICLGLPLAHRMLPLMIASLLQNYDWKLEGGKKPEEMDMSEKFGLTVQKALALKCIPIRTTI